MDEKMTVGSSTTTLTVAGSASAWQGSSTAVTTRTPGWSYCGSEHEPVLLEAPAISRASHELPRSSVMRTVRPAPATGVTATVIVIEVPKGTVCGGFVMVTWY